MSGHIEILFPENPLPLYICYPILTFLVALRIWIRLRLLRARLELSDAFVLLSWTTITVAFISGVTYLTDLKNKDRTSGTGLVTVLKVQWALMFCYYVMTVSTKAAFLATYYKLQVQLRYRCYRNAWRCITAWVVVGFIISELLYLLWCRPVTNNWNPESFCSVFSSTTVIGISYFFSMSSDILVLMFPLMLFRKLRFNRRETLAFFFLVLVGMTSPAAETIRFALIIRSTIGRHSGSSVVGLMNIIEVLAGLVACCLPAYRPLLKYLPPSLSHSSVSRNFSRSLNCIWARDDKDRLPSFVKISVGGNQGVPEEITSPAEYFRRPRRGSTPTILELKTGAEKSETDLELERKLGAVMI